MRVIEITSSAKNNVNLETYITTEYYLDVFVDKEIELYSKTFREITVVSELCE